MLVHSYLIDHFIVQVCMCTSYTRSSPNTLKSSSPRSTSITLSRHIADVDDGDDDDDDDDTEQGPDSNSSL